MPLTVFELNGFKTAVLVEAVWFYQCAPAVAVFIKAVAAMQQLGFLCNLGLILVHIRNLNLNFKVDQQQLALEQVCSSEQHFVFWNSSTAFWGTTSEISYLRRPPHQMKPSDPHQTKPGDWHTAGNQGECK